MLLWNVFSQVLLPILLMFGAGWLLDRRFRLDLGTMVKLNIYLLVPAFIFVQIVNSGLVASMALRVIGFTFTIIVCMLLLGAVIGKFAGYPTPQTRSLQLAAMFYNSGNFGVPLMTLAYPGLGPVLQVFIILTQNVSMFTIGLLLATTSPRRGWRTFLPMLRQVSLWAVLMALTIRAFHWPIQQWRWLWVPLEYFAAALVGVALLTLGVQLSQAEKPRHFSRLGWALGLRLLIGPALACLLVPVFGFTGDAAKIMILSAGFPTAINTALLAHEFNADAHFAAAAVFYSTLLSMLSVTVLIAILRVA